MNISLKTEYALRALYELSHVEDKKPIRREQIAEAQKIPLHFLEHILIDLKKQGLIRSVRGPGGGYVLDRSIEDINLWDIYTAVDYKEHDGVRCFPGLSKECDHLAECKIKNMWFQFNDLIRNSMSQMTLQSLR